jgi:ABC-type transport system involved in multi-copper enzyme maturation permease subunit
MRKQTAFTNSFWQTTWTLGLREWLSSLRSPALYIAGVIAAFFQMQILAAQMSFINDYRLFVVRDPLIPAFLGAVAVAAIYITTTSTTTLVREREQQTLRDLFYTPVSHSSLVAGKFTGQLLNGVTVLLIAFLVTVIGAWLTQFILSAQFLFSVILCVLLIANMIAFGLVLSAFAPTARAAVLLLFVTIIAMVGIQIGERVIAFIGPLFEVGFFGYLMPVINTLTLLAGYVSPLAYLLRGLEAIAQSNGAGILLGVISSLAYTAVFLYLASWISNWRGVSR